MSKDPERSKPGESFFKLARQEELYEIQDNFARASGVGSGIMDADGKWVAPPSNMCGFCKLIRSTRKGTERCRQCDFGHGRKAERRKGPFVYTCHAGLTDFAICIKVAGRTAGYMLGGQVLTSPLNSRHKARFREVARELDLDENKLIKAASKLKVMSRARVAEIAEGMGSCADLISHMLAAAWRKEQLNRAAAKMFRARDQETALHIALEVIQQVVGYRTCSICLLDKESGQITVAAHKGMNVKLVKSGYLKLGEGLAGWVAERGERAVVSDWRKDPRSLKRLIRQGTNREMRSVVFVPLRGMNGDVIGVIGAGSTRVAEYTEDDARFVEMLGEYISTALEKLQTADGLLQQQIGLAIGKKMAKRMNPWEIRQDTLNLILEQAMGLPDVKHASIRLADPERQDLMFIAWLGSRWPDAKLARIYSFRKGHTEGLGGLAAARRKPVLARKLPDKEHWPKYVQIFRSVRCSLSMPVVVRGSTVAVITIDSIHEDAFGRKHLDALANLAQLTGGVFQSIELAANAVLWEIDTQLHQRPRGSQTLKWLVRKAREVVGGQGCSIFLHDKASNRFRLAATTGIERKRAKKSTDVYYEEGQGLTGWVAKSGTSLLVRDVNNASAIRKMAPGAAWRNTYAEKGVTASTPSGAQYMAVSIFVLGKVAGVIRVSAATEGAIFSQYDLRLLERIAATLGATMEKEVAESRLAREREWNEAMAKLAQELGNARKLTDAIRVAVNRGLDALGCHSGHLRLWDDSIHRLALVHAKGKFGRCIPEHRELGDGISGRAGESREPVLIHDAPNDPTFRLLLRKHRGTVFAKFLRSIGSEISLPLITGGRLVGVFNAHWPRPHEFDDLSVAMIQDLANHMASTINRLRLTEEAGTRATSLKRLTEATLKRLSVASERTVRSMLEDIIEIAAEAVHSESCHLFLWDEKAGEVILRAARGIDGSLVGQARYSLGEGITGWVAETGRIVRGTHAEIRRHPAHKGKYDSRIAPSLPSGRFRSLLSAPIRTQDGILGVLTFNNKQQHEIKEIIETGFGHVDEDTAAIMGWQIGTYIENLKSFGDLNHLLDATKDILATGDLNHALRSLEHRVTEAVGEERATVHVFNRDMSVLQPVGEPVGVPRRLTRDIGLNERSIVAHVARTGRRLVAPNVKECKHYMKVYPDTASEVALPLILRGEVAGVLDVESTRPNAFGERRVRLLDNFASIGALAIERSKMATRTLLEGQTAGLGRLGAMVAHQITNALTSISDGVHEAARQEGVPPAAERWLNQVKHHVDVLASYALRVSAVTKPATEDKEPCDVRDLVKTIVSVVKNMLSRDNITVRTRLEDQLSRAQVLANRGAMFQAIMNIVHNAADAMPRGGCLTISGRYDEKARSVVLRVRDTGCGMTKEQIPRVFEAWFTTKPDGTGTGLGLYVARQCIEEQNGTITIERTAEGKGTTFAIRLPVSSVLSTEDTP